MSQETFCDVCRAVITGKGRWTGSLSEVSSQVVPNPKYERVDICAECIDKIKNRTK